MAQSHKNSFNFEDVSGNNKEEEKRSSSIAGNSNYFGGGRIGLTSNMEDRDDDE